MRTPSATGDRAGRRAYGASLRHAGAGWIARSAQGADTGAGAADGFAIGGETRQRLEFLFLEGGPLPVDGPGFLLDADRRELVATEGAKHLDECRDHLRQLRLDVGERGLADIGGEGIGGIDLGGNESVQFRRVDHGARAERFGLAFELLTSRLGGARKAQRVVFGFLLEGELRLA